ncbi:MAG: flagellar assembly protein FliW [Wolinella sp.]
MVYELKSPILGFEKLNEIELIEIDEVFSQIESTGSEGIALTLVNPYALREYSFEIPTAIQMLLDITQESKVRVLCVVVVQNPITESCINFLAPLIFNDDNKTAAQVALNAKEYPHFGLADKIKAYVKG